MSATSKNVWDTMYYYNDNNKYALYRTTSVNCEYSKKSDRMLKSVSPQYRSERPAIEKAEKIWKFSSPQYGSQRTGNRVLRFSDEERAGGGNRAVRFSESQRSASRVLRLTEDQEAVLREQFNRWPRAPHTGDVVLLAAETGLSEADVKDWYAIRLAQWRKEQGLGGNLGLH